MVKKYNKVDNVVSHRLYRIVTHEKVQTHGEIEAEFKSEDSIKDVQEHYPDEPMPVF